MFLKQWRAVIAPIFFGSKIREIFLHNRVGGKQSSFSPTFVFRPLTPPYMRFRIRRFLFWVPFDV